MRLKWEKTGLCVLLVVTALLVNNSFGGNWIAFEVSPSGNDQEAPDIDGDVIVWQELAEGDEGVFDWDIMGAEISDPAEPLVFTVSNYSNDEKNPAISDYIVVWQDDYNGIDDWDIYYMDLSDPDSTEQLLTDIPASQINPAIYGNTVVFQDDFFGDWDVGYANIDDPNRIFDAITPFAFNQENPSVYRNKVMWEDDYSDEEFFYNPEGAWNVWGADTMQWLADMKRDYKFLSADYLVDVSSMPEDQQYTAVSDRYVVWQQNFGGDWDIYGADISDPANPDVFVIAFDTSSSEKPDVDGNIVVWQDDRNGDWDIYGYNLTTRREFLISDNQPGQNVYSDQTNPKISGNIVVWEDNLNQKMSIYMAILDGPDIADCRFALPGDVNGDCAVDLADFVEVSENWLLCGLEPFEACP